MADKPKTKPYTYTGNPGYSFPFARDLNPGDVVDLTDDQAAQVGDDFTPKTTKAPAAASSED